jgi:hypothetical protein
VRAVIVIAWVCVGCRKTPAVDAGSVAWEQAAQDESVQVSGPQRWAEDGGACVRVPEGWVGQQIDATLEVKHEESGISFRLSSDPNPPGPRAKREGYTLVFEDAGAYRRPAVLAPAGTATWRAEDGSGTLVQSWFGEVDGRTIRAEFTVPQGGRNRGAAAVDAMLQGMCDRRAGYLPPRPAR